MNSASCAMACFLIALFAFTLNSAHHNLETIMKRYGFLTICAFFLLVSGANAIPLPSYTIGASGTINSGWIVTGIIEEPGFPIYDALDGLPFYGVMHLDFMDYLGSPEHGRPIYSLTFDLWVDGFYIDDGIGHEGVFSTVIYNDQNSDFGFRVGAPDDPTKSAVININYFANGQYANSLFLDTWDLPAIGVSHLMSTDVSFNVRQNPVPEPASFILFGIGLFGFAFIGRKLSERKGAFPDPL
jgi:hypothetical protein